MAEKTAQPIGVKKIAGAKGGEAKAKKDFVVKSEMKDMKAQAKTGNATGAKAATTEAKAKPKKKANEFVALASGSSSLIAIVRVRGLTGMHPKRRDTLLMLNLKRSNQATLVHNNASYAGMLIEGKDYIAWGPISTKVVEKMIFKRGEIGSKKISEIKKPEEVSKMAEELIAGKSLKELGINRSIRLAPPSGGWKARKKRVPYGDLGPHESMDRIVLRMI